MPRQRKFVQGIDADALQKLIQNGADSDLLRARVLYSDADTFRKYLVPVAFKALVHPSMLPTQTSGRWSTLSPPRLNFATGERAKEKGLPPIGEVFVPHQGHYWLSFDWDAIEAKMLAALSGDEADLQAFNQDWDIHTITACDMFKLPLPKDKTNAIHSCECEDCAGWREIVGWGGKDDLRRNRAKTARYALGYGGDPKNPYDLRRAAKSILGGRGVERLGLREAQLIEGGVLYLQSKRDTLVRWKAETWAECIRTRQSRTHRGRRRMLFGPPESMAREGLNHEVQGGVADEMNVVIIAVVHPRDGRYGRVAWLELNKHDGAMFSFPETIPPEEAAAAIKPIVESEWNVFGHRIRATAAWVAVLPDGKKVKLRVP